MNRVLAFKQLEEWFALQRRENERAWMQVVAKHGADPLFGRYLRAAGHGGKVEFPIFGEATSVLGWCHEGPLASRDAFYFNCVGRDLGRGEFEKIKNALHRVLGTPDEVSEYWGMAEPTWTNGRTSIRLYHVDSHGGGYERIEVSTNSAWLRSA
jgi:hypothetical protein